MFSAAWNTSIPAMHALSQIPPVQYRNQKLNAKYFSKLYHSAPNTSLTSSMIHNQQSNNLPGQFQRFIANPLWRDTPNYQIQDVKLDLHKIRAIHNMIKRPGDVASAIKMNEKVIMNSLLTTAQLSRDQQKTLISWRLGRVATHQECLKCHSELSRQHALECSEAIHVIENEFPELYRNHGSINILDAAINKLNYNSSSASKTCAVILAIRFIQIECLHWRRNGTNELVPPRHYSLNNIIAHGNPRDVH